MEKETQDYLLDLIAQKRYRVDTALATGLDGGYELSKKDLKIYEQEHDKLQKAAIELASDSQVSKDKLIIFLDKTVREELEKEEKQRAESYRNKPINQRTEIENQEDTNGFFQYLAKMNLLSHIIIRIIKEL